MDLVFRRKGIEMDYLLTFEDGSEGHLAHHGIKGMKWGVWNAETAARHRGGTRKIGVPPKKRLDSDMRKTNVYKKGFAKAVKGLDIYDPSDKTHRYDVTEFRDRAKNDLAIYNRSFKNAKTEKDKKFYKNASIESNAEIDVFNKWLKCKTATEWKTAQKEASADSAKGNKRLNKTNRSEIDLGKTTVQHLIAQQQQQHHLQLQNQMLLNQQMQQHSQEAVRQSVNAANQAASLSMTGGTNPYMFGHM